MMFEIESEDIADQLTVAYTLHVVGQDTFEDVIVPGEGNSQPPKTPNVSTNGVR